MRTPHPDASVNIKITPNLGATDHTSTLETKKEHGINIPIIRSINSYEENELFKTLALGHT